MAPPTRSRPSTIPRRSSKWRSGCTDRRDSRSSPVVLPGPEAPASGPFQHKKSRRAHSLIKPRTGCKVAGRFPRTRSLRRTRAPRHQSALRPTPGNYRGQHLRIVIERIEQRSPVELPGQRTRMGHALRRSDLSGHASGGLRSRASQHADPAHRVPCITAPGIAAYFCAGDCRQPHAGRIGSGRALALLPSRGRTALGPTLSSSRGLLISQSGFGGVRREGLRRCAESARQLRRVAAGPCAAAPAERPHCSPPARPRAP
jgi:hypothetical protein